jgi:hypothetical protein
VRLDDFFALGCELVQLLGQALDNPPATWDNAGAVFLKVRHACGTFGGSLRHGRAAKHPNSNDSQNHPHHNPLQFFMESYLSDTE